MLGLLRLGIAGDGNLHPDTLRVSGLGFRVSDLKPEKLAMLFAGAWLLSVIMDDTPQLSTLYSQAMQSLIM